MSLKSIKCPYTKVTKNNNVYEVSYITDSWDECQHFNETLYLHYINLGWTTEEFEKIKGESENEV